MWGSFLSRSVRSKRGDVSGYASATVTGALSPITVRGTPLPHIGDLMTLADQEVKTRTAFLALDFATYIVENFSHDAAVAEQASNAMASARAAGLPVFHVLHE